MKPSTKTMALVAACLVLNIGLIFLVASGQGSTPALAAYAASMFTCIAVVLRTGRRRGSARGRDRVDLGGLDLAAAVGVMAVQLAVLIYMSTFQFHYVQDEFITGYTSYMLPAVTEIDWFAGYPPPGEWIASFPILYYALQKPFIETLGLSLETIRISTWPYHLLTTALVYLLGREMFTQRRWAIAGSVIYVLLAPNAYMAGYGMHNISSTFFFLAAFYAAVRMLRNDDALWAAASGIFAVMAYLTYTSSYLTVPLLLALAVIWAISERSRRPLLRFGQVLLIVVVGLVPFVTHAVAYENYFTERGDQVNALAEFYGNPEVEDPTGRLIEHMQTNVRSLYTPGIGGVTDYWFGKQALFDWLTLGLLLTGLGLGVYRGLARGRRLELFAVIAVLATFVSGMLLTLPAGGFHRTTLAFPFAALLIAMTIGVVSEQVRRISSWKPMVPTVSAALLALFAIVNVGSLQAMVREDREISSLTDSVPITEYVEANVPPGEEILITAFPNYHLERELIVRTGDRYEVRIAPFDDAIERAGTSVVVLFQPDEAQIHRLEARHDGGGFIDAWDGHDLERHRIWAPPALTAQ